MSESQQTIDWAETRKLTTRTLILCERILAMISIHAPNPCGSISKLKIPVIRSIVAAKFGFCGDDLITQNRRPKVSWARMLAMFFCREMTDASLNELGRDFQRDHAAIFHAIQTVKARCSTESECAKDVEDLKKQLIQNLQ